MLALSPYFMATIRKNPYFIILSKAFSITLSLTMLLQVNAPLTAFAMTSNAEDNAEDNAEEYESVLASVSIGTSISLCSDSPDSLSPYGSSYTSWSNFQSSCSSAGGNALATFDGTVGCGPRSNPDSKFDWTGTCESEIMVTPDPSIQGCPVGKDCAVFIKTPGSVLDPGEGIGIRSICETSGQICREQGYEDVVCSPIAWAKAEWQSPGDNFQRDYVNGAWTIYGASGDNDEYWTKITCQKPATPTIPLDVCPNIDGVQDTVPSGNTVDGSGNCVPIDLAPIGFLDSASCSTFNGWTYDPDEPSVSNVVHFYADGPAGSGIFIGAMNVDQPRPDINSAYNVLGNHGFSFVTPVSLKDGGTHTIYAYGINTNPANPDANNSVLPQSWDNLIDFRTISGCTTGDGEVPITPTTPGTPNTPVTPTTPLPIFTTILSANPTILATGATSVISWATTGASSCTASGDWSGAQATSGTQTVGPFSVTSVTTRNFTLSCTNASGTVTSSVSITVNPPGVATIPTSTIGSFSISPTTIVSGSNATLSWTSSNTTLCVASGSWSGNKSVAGSETVGPFNSSVATNFVFNISCGNALGTTTTSTTLSVTPPAPATVPAASSGGGGGGRSGGPCIGYGCTATGGSSVPADVWILIDTVSSGGTASGPAKVCKYDDFLTSFMKKGISNNPNDVKKLQYFLNIYEAANLPVNGEFDLSTENAVKAFQAKYTESVLLPWGTTTPTGIVYITTTAEINRIFCGDNPEYRAGDLDNVLDNVLYTPVDNINQFEGVVGFNSSSSTSTIANNPNIGAVFGSISGKILDIVKTVPWYPILVLILVLLGTGLVVHSILIKDIASGTAIMSLIRGSAILGAGTLLNTANTLTYMLDSDWFTSHTELGLSWVLGLDLVNLLSLAFLCMFLLIMLLSRSMKKLVNTV